MWTLSHSTSSNDSPQLSAALETAKKAVAALKARKDLGFWQLPEREQLWVTSEARGREIRTKSNRLVVLGMGGSSLGGRALLQALNKWRDTHSVHFIDNVDADVFWKWLRSRTDTQLQDTHWVIVSKSGNTIETLTMAEFVEQYLREKGFKKLSAVSTVVSESDDNPLMRWARKENVACLEIPKDVGGRFSVLTPVGLLPAAYYGVDLAALREGAAWALTQDDLIAQLTAQTLASWQRDEWITQFWAYSDGLKDFGLWTQQLWAESLGKAKARHGGKAPRCSTPMAATGSSDQHSILQQVMEGARDKFLWFMRVQSSEAGGPVIEKNLFDCQQLMHGKSMGQLFGAMATATRDALAKQGVHSITLTTEQLNERSIGALFMILELVVGSLGEAMDINAFDQPGVEAGKVIARGILQNT
jgi:glucose-6-phosphate isomerase